MANTVLIAEDDPSCRRFFHDSLKSEGYKILLAVDGNEALRLIEHQPIDLLLTDYLMPGLTGIELLERARSICPDLRAIVVTGHGTPETVLAAFRNQACAFLSKPVNIEELRDTVRIALEGSGLCRVEIISAKPDWVEISVPCDMRAAEPIHSFMTEIECDIPQETREAIGATFREMLSNAIEHGGKFDPSKRVIVKYVRLKRAVMYSIKDPGEGFDIGKIEHAAFANPEDDPIRHMEIREQKGIRPGGFGIMLASQMVDELIYNERHNELIFVKYIDVN